VTGSERRIPVQYAKKVVGRKMYGGQSSNLPIKLNMTGVMPIIFASSIVSFFPTVFQILETAHIVEEGTFWAKFADVIGTDGFVYPIMLFILIIAFAYFYTQITFDPMEVANNLKQQGGAIPGIRQGRPTADYIRKILNKITLAGALFLGFIAVLPIILGPHAFQYLFEWIVDGSIHPEAVIGSSGGSDFLYVGGQILERIQYVSSVASSLTTVFTFGGTTLLIVVGVAIETFRELEAQLTMRNYKGFLN
jgi:preprotein translocase subunit SecY